MLYPASIVDFDPTHDFSDEGNASGLIMGELQVEGRVVLFACSGCDLVACYSRLIVTSVGGGRPVYTCKWYCGTHKVWGPRQGQLLKRVVLRKLVCLWRR